MKVYKKLIKSAKVQASAAAQHKEQPVVTPAPEPTVVTPEQDAKVRFMQNIIRQARVDQ